MPRVTPAVVAGPGSQPGLPDLLLHGLTPPRNDKPRSPLLGWSCHKVALLGLMQPSLGALWAQGQADLVQIQTHPLMLSDSAVT